MVDKNIIDNKKIQTGLRFSAWLGKVAPESENGVDDAADSEADVGEGEAEELELGVGSPRFHRLADDQDDDEVQNNR